MQAGSGGFRLLIHDAEQAVHELVVDRAVPFLAAGSAAARAGRPAAGRCGLAVLLRLGLVLHRARVGAGTGSMGRAGRTGRSLAAAGTGIAGFRRRGAAVRTRAAAGVAGRTGRSIAAARAGRPAAGRTCAGRTAGTAGRARTARAGGSGDFLRRILHLAARSRRAGRTGRTRAGSAARTAGRTGGAARTDAALKGDG